MKRHCGSLLDDILANAKFSGVTSRQNAPTAVFGVGMEASGTSGPSPEYLRVLKSTESIKAAAAAARRMVEAHLAVCESPVQQLQLEHTSSVEEPELAHPSTGQRDLHMPNCCPTCGHVRDTDAPAPATPTRQDQNARAPLRLSSPEEWGTAVRNSSTDRQQSSEVTSPSQHSSAGIARTSRRRKGRRNARGYRRQHIDLEDRLDFNIESLSSSEASDVVLVEKPKSGRVETSEEVKRKWAERQESSTIKIETAFIFGCTSKQGKDGEGSRGQPGEVPSGRQARTEPRSRSVVVPLRSPVTRRLKRQLWKAERQCRMQKEVTEIYVEKCWLQDMELEALQRSEATIREKEEWQDSYFGDDDYCRRPGTADGIRSSVDDDFWNTSLRVSSPQAFRCSFDEATSCGS